MKAGRYEVFWKIDNKWQVILEKTIDVNGFGNNHTPIFLFRRANLPFGKFTVSVEDNTVVFAYQDLPIIDRLIELSDGSWSGKLFYNNNFIDYFKFRRK